MNYKEYHKKYLKKFKLKFTSNRRAKLIYTGENTNKCPYCGKETITDIEHGEIYCSQCGLILKTSILYTSLRRLNPIYGVLLSG